MHIQEREPVKRDVRTGRRRRSITAQIADAEIAGRPDDCEILKMDPSHGRLRVVAEADLAVVLRRVALLQRQHEGLLLEHVRVAEVERDISEPNVLQEASALRLLADTDPGGPCAKTPFGVCFPCVCPEPVLVKRIFLAQNGTQKTISYLCSRCLRKQYPPAENAHFFSTSLCLSRACLGQIDRFIPQSGSKKALAAPRRPAPPIR